MEAKVICELLKNASKTLNDWRHEKQHCLKRIDSLQKECELKDQNISDLTLELVKSKKEIKLLNEKTPSVQCDSDDNDSDPEFTSYFKKRERDPMEEPMDTGACSGPPVSQP